MEMSEHTSYKQLKYCKRVSTVNCIFLMVKIKKKDNMSMFLKS